MNRPERSKRWSRPPLARVIELCLIGILGLTTGCADYASFDAGGSFEEATASGQTLALVGTDPEALSTDIYLVRAVGVGVGAAPNIAQADSFELEPITRSVIDDSNAVVVGDSEHLFSDRIPFPVPDRVGNRLTFIVTTDGDETELPTARAVITTLSPRSSVQSPNRVGLFGARFTWLGDYLLLQHTDPETQRDRLVATTPDLLEDANGWADLGPEDPELHVQFQGLLSESNSILALVSEPVTGATSLYLLDPETGSAVSLTDQVQATVGESALSPDGSMVAITTHQLQPDTRGIVLIDVATGKAQSITDSLGADCYWPTFAPRLTADDSTLLAFVCQYPDSGRPDIVLWSAPSNGLDLATDALPDPEILTAAPQPAVFDGTMDGLVIRSPPRWDPRRSFLVFGASTEEEAFDGEGLTLFALPIDSTATPIYSGVDTSADWAHFSNSSEASNLLVWERSETGLDDTLNSTGEHHQPIRVIAIDDTPPQISYVELGVNLRVGYPLFLGDNSLFYP